MGAGRRTAWLLRPKSVSESTGACLCACWYVWVGVRGLCDAHTCVNVGRRACELMRACVCAWIGVCGRV